MRVKDEATPVLEKGKQATKELAAETEKAAQKNNQAGTSWQNIAKGVFAGATAAKAAQAAFGFLQGQLSSSISEAMEFQRVDAQLTAALNSTGGAVGLTKDQLTSYAGELSRLTAIDDDAIKSAEAVLLKFTNLREDGFKKATQAVLDLATAQNGGGIPSMEQLQSTAQMLGKALNNPAQAFGLLQKAGVTFSKAEEDVITKLQQTGHQAEAVDKIMQGVNRTVGGSASAAAQTFEGRLQKLTNAFNDIKKEVGLGLMAVLVPYVDATTEATEKTVQAEEQTHKLRSAIYGLGQVFRGVYFILEAVIKIFGSFAVFCIKATQVVFNFGKDVAANFKMVGEAARALISGIIKLSSGDFKGALEDIRGLLNKGFDFKSSANSAKEFGTAMQNSFNSVGDSLTKAGEAFKESAVQKELPKIIKQMETAQIIADAQARAYQEMNDAMMAGGAKASSKVKESLKDLAKSYTEQSDKAKEELTKLELAHAETTENIKGKINELKNSLGELEAAYKKTMGDINKSEAERVVEQEQKIKDLQKQLDEAKKSNQETPSADNQAKVTEAQAALDKEQAAYKAYIEQRKGLDNELAEARRRAALTDFQRSIEDINARRTEAEAEHTKKMEQFKAEIAEQEVNLAREQIIFEAKRQEYLATQEAFTKFHDDYLAKITSMKTVTQATVDQMKTKLNEIVTLVAQIESARNKAGLQGLAQNAVQAPAGVGTTTQPVAQSQTININLGGVTVTDEATKDQLVKDIVRQFELAKMGAAS